MGQIAIALPPPEYWQDLEEITLGICEAEWPEDNPVRYGRSGQEQHGVDIYCYRRTAKEMIGVQCKKKRQQDASGKIMVGGNLTAQIIDDEVAKAEQFFRPLDLFILATTALRDTAIQSYILDTNVTRSASNQFRIAIWFWEDYQSFFNRHPQLMYRYYETVMKKYSEYNPDIHILSLVQLAFSRAAFNTPFYLENNTTDFFEALKDTQSAIKTGRLKDREDRGIIRSAPSGVSGLSEATWRGLMTEVEEILTQIRDIYTEAEQRKVIVNHGTCIIVKDHEVSQKMNCLRKDAILKVNSILSEAGLEPVISRLLNY